MMFCPMNVNGQIIRIWGVVWIAIVGEIWKHRNKCVFNNGRVDHIEVFTMAQRKTWAWLTSKEKGADFSYSYWCLEPLVCLKIVN